MSMLKEERTPQTPSVKHLFCECVHFGSQCGCGQMAIAMGLLGSCGCGCGGEYGALAVYTVACECVSVHASAFN